MCAASSVGPPTTPLDSYYAQLRAQAFNRHAPSANSSVVAPASSGAQDNEEEEQDISSVAEAAAAR